MSERRSTASIVAEVLALRAHPEGRPHPAGRRRHRRRRSRCRSAAAPSTWLSATACRSPRSAPTMPGGLEIARRKLRGEWSNGMLCSPTELGLGDDAGGILVLPSDLPLGAPVFDALGVTSDVVFDLDLTRNRPDAYSHRGVARDVAAVHSACPSPTSPPAVEPSGPAVTTPVDLVDPVGCGRFTATVLTGVEVKPSRTVDGRAAAPGRHAADQQRRRRLQLRHARAGPAQPPVRPRPPARSAPSGSGGPRPGETMTTLDDVERTFTTDDLLICDGEDTPIGIAGIMGGASSEIHEGTTTVALEMAWFEPGGVARTAARLGLRSEASARFERGVDPYVIDAADRPLRRAAARDEPGGAGGARRGRRARRAARRLPRRGCAPAASTSCSASS